MLSQAELGRQVDQAWCVVSVYSPCNHQRFIKGIVRLMWIIIANPDWFLLKESLNINSVCTDFPDKVISLQKWWWVRLEGLTSAGFLAAVAFPSPQCYVKKGVGIILSSVTQYGQMALNGAFEGFPGFQVFCSLQCSFKSMKHGFHRLWNVYVFI